MSRFDLESPIDHTTKVDPCAETPDPNDIYRWQERPMKQAPDKRVVFLIDVFHQQLLEVIRRRHYEQYGLILNNSDLFRISLILFSHVMQLTDPAFSSYKRNPQKQEVDFTQHENRNWIFPYDNP